MIFASTRRCATSQDLFFASLGSPTYKCIGSLHHQLKLRNVRCLGKIGAENTLGFGVRVVVASIKPFLDVLDMGWPCSRERSFRHLHLGPTLSSIIPEGELPDCFRSWFYRMFFVRISNLLLSLAANILCTGRGARHS